MWMARKQGNIDYQLCDSLVTFAQQNGMKFRGHALAWGDNANIPGYVKAMNKNQVTAWTKNYVQGVASHYKGKAFAWDVLNEVINGVNVKNSAFSQIPDFIC